MRLLVVLLFSISSLCIYGQNAFTCAEADPFCSDIVYTFPLSTGSTAEIGPDYMCLGSEPNPVWYYLKVAESGDIVISIRSDTGNDIDFACWGPFNSPTSPCSGQLTSSMRVDCSYSAASTESCEIYNAIEDEYYILVITNFSSRDGDLLFTQSNFGSTGAGRTDCSIVNLCGFVEVDDSVKCGTTSGTYDIEGSVSFVNNPLTGTLTVTTNTGEQQVYNAPFTSPMSYSFSDITDPDALTDLTFAFSDSSTCIISDLISKTVTCESCLPPTSVSIQTQSGEIEFCEGDSVEFLVLETIGIAPLDQYNYSIFTSDNDVIYTGLLPPSGTELSQLAREVTYTYRIEDGNNGNATCYLEDQISLSISDSVLFDLGADTTICAGQTLSLSPGISGNYLWSDGSTGTSLNVTTAGVYSVIITDGACSNADTIEVFVQQAPDFDLGNDTAICVGDSIELTAGVADRYLWSTGDTLQSIMVDIDDMYFVTATNGNCQFVENISVSLNSLPDVSLGNDTVACDSLVLESNATFDRYLWSTADSTQRIVVTTSDDYILTATQMGCQNSDTVFVEISEPANIFLGNDTAICAGDSILISADVADSYLWSTGNTTQSIYVSESGDYSVTITSGVCSDADTISITVNPLPTVSVGNDTIVCDSLVLASNAGFDAYLWSTSEITQNIIVRQTGEYILTATQLGCENSDTINIEISESFEVNLGNDTTICEGTFVTLNAGVGDAYIWNTSDITFEVSVSIPDNYSVTVTKGACVSEDEILISNDPNLIPTVSFTASASEICDGTIVNFDVDVTDNLGTDPVFDWYINDVFQISDPSFSSGTLMNDDVVKLVGTSSERCLLQDTAAAVIQMTVNPNLIPVVELHADQTLICDGETINFSIANIDNQGTAPTYNWYLNDVSISNYTDTYSSSTLSDGDEIKVEITSSEICLEQTNAYDSILIGVTDLVTPMVSIAPDVDTTCETFPITFSIAEMHGAGNTPTYQWTINGNNISTSASFTSVDLIDGDIIELTMNTTAECAASTTASDSYQMTLIPLVIPEVDIESDLYEICSGENVSVQVIGMVHEGDMPDFDWYVNGVNQYENGDNFTSPQLRSNSSYISTQMTSSYLCVSNSTASDTVEIVIVELELPEIEIEATNLCEYTDIIVTIADSSYGGQNPVFTWYVNDQVVAGSDYLRTDTLSANAEIKLGMLSGGECPLIPEVFDSINVLPSPQIVIDFPEDLCLKESPYTIVVTNDNGNGGNSSVVPTLGLQQSGSVYRFNPQIASTGDHTLEFSWTDNNGCISDSNVTITVHDIEPPVAQTTYSDLIDYTPYETFSAMGTGQINWYDDDMNILSSGSDTYIPSRNCTADECVYTYFVSQTDNDYGCESDPVQITYTQTRCPVPFPDADPVFACDYWSGVRMHADTATVWERESPQGQSTLYWYLPGGDPDSPIFTGLNHFDPSPYVNGADTYRFEVRAYSPGHGCPSAPTSVTLEIHHTPEPDLLGSDFTICEMQLNPEFRAIGQNIKWFGSTDTSNAAISIGERFISSETSRGVYHYYVTQTIGGCGSSALPVSLTINAKPGTPEIYDNDGCQYAPHILTAQNATAAYTIEWFNNDGESISDDDLTYSVLNIDEDWLQVSERVRFGATFTSTENCVSDTSYAFYRMIPTPADPVIIYADEAHCYFDIPDSITIFTIAENIFWYEDSVSEETRVAYDTLQYTPVIEEIKDKKYLVLANNEGRCYSDTVEIRVPVYDVPTAKINGTTKVCERSYKELYSPDFVIDTNSYSWSVSGDVIVSAADNNRYIRVDWADIGIETIYMQEVTPQGCINNQMMVVSIAPKPEVDFSMDRPGALQNVVFENMTYQDPIVEDTTVIMPIVTSYWNYGRESDLFETVHSYSQLRRMDTLFYNTGDYTITLRVETDHGCKEQTSQGISIDIHKGLFIPTAFCPASTSHALREFLPTGENIESFTMSIYDSWGNLLFFTDKVSKEGRPAKGWDGKYNGSPMKSDVYIWKIEASYRDGEEWKGIEDWNGLYKKYGSFVLVR